MEIAFVVGAVLGSCVWVPPVLVLWWCYWRQCGRADGAEVMNTELSEFADRMGRRAAEAELGEDGDDDDDVGGEDWKRGG
jgi:hypothetical protein